MSMCVGGERSQLPEPGSAPLSSSLRPSLCETFDRQTAGQKHIAEKDIGRLGDRLHTHTHTHRPSSPLPHNPLHLFHTCPFSFLCSSYLPTSLKETQNHLEVKSQEAGVGLWRLGKSCLQNLPHAETQLRSSSVSLES